MVIKVLKCVKSVLLELLANGFHMESDFDQALVVENFAAVKNESWLLHDRMEALIVVEFELVPLCANHDGMGLLCCIEGAFANLK